LWPGTPNEDTDFANGHAIPLYAAYQHRLKTLNAADFGDVAIHVWRRDGQAEPPDGLPDLLPMRGNGDGDVPQACWGFAQRGCLCVQCAEAAREGERPCGCSLRVLTQQEVQQRRTKPQLESKRIEEHE